VTKQILERGEGWGDDKKKESYRNRLPFCEYELVLSISLGASDGGTPSGGARIDFRMKELSQGAVGLRQRKSRERKLTLCGESGPSLQQQRRIEYSMLPEEASPEGEEKTRKGRLSEEARRRSSVPLRKTALTPTREKTRQLQGRIKAGKNQNVT